MNFKRFTSKYWLVLVLLIFVLLKIPSLFEPFTYGDEGIYLTLGQAARKGVVWYSQIHDNKPPMLYLMAAIANSFPSYRMINFIWSLATIFAFYRLAKLVFSKNKLAIVLSTAALAVSSSLHSLEGNVANAENFMMLPTIIAFYLIYKALSNKIPHRPMLNLLRANWAWLLAGGLFSIATLFKVPAAFDFAAAIVLVLLVIFEAKKKDYSLYAKRYTLLFVGFLFPILATMVYYFFKGALLPYLTAAFFQNLPYLSSWAADKPQAGGFPTLLLARGGLILLMTILIYYYRKRLSLATKLILLWFSFSWFAALLSARPYPHYLIQILPPLSLSFGYLAIKSKKEWQKALFPLVLILIFRITFAVFHFWDYPNRPYYLNFCQFALGLKTKEEYFLDFDPQSLDLYQTADYLQDRTLPDEKIFIWGTQPSIYSLARRLPVGRYTSSYHIIDFNGYQDTLEKLSQKPPRYLLVTGDEKRPFPALVYFIHTHYTFEKQIGNIQIFHRILTSHQPE